ncbi:MAG: hypothetical protein R3C18_07010 [Planctomycetaceae bacterium]
MTKESSNRPVETMSALGVSAKVFENVSESGHRYDRVQIVRTYRDGNAYKTTSTFSIDELPIVESFARKAYEFCIKRRSAELKNGDKD